MTTDQQAGVQPEDSERIEPDYPKDRTTIGGPRLGVVGWTRWVWRQLTSMRTALALLLLGRGSLPGLVVMGSVWWALGWLMQSAAQVGGAQAADVRARAQALQERLRQVAQQRSSTGTGKKKP